MAAAYAPRFEAYFQKEVARKAAKSLSDGAEIEFAIRAGNETETFTFTKLAGANAVRAGAARTPQVVFTMTPQAAERILTHPSDDIASIAVNIAQLIAQPANPADGAKIDIQLKAGFLSLFSQGYLGVVTSGGSQFASFLASKGLNGMGAIKDLIKKLKG